MVYDIGVAPSTPPSVGKGGGGLAGNSQGDNDDLTAPLVSTPLSEVGEGENRGNRDLGGSSSSPPSSPFCYPKSGVGQHGPFFDMESTLDIPMGVARGYMVLLTGGKMEVPTVGGHTTVDGEGGKLSAKIKSRLSLTRANSKADGAFPTAEGLEVELKEGDATEHPEEKHENKDMTNHDKPPMPTDSMSESDADQPSLTAAGVSVTEVFMEDPSDGSVEIAFMALTDGNVIDACFGVRHQAAFLGLPSPRRTGNHSKKAARNAKELLREASESHEAIRLLAVEAYARAFEIVMKYHRSLEDNGIVGWCWKAKKIRDQSVRDLVAAFDHLTGAVEATL